MTVRDPLDAAAAMAAPCTILVIEDEAPIRDLIARRIAAWGYRALTAASGRSGIRIIADKPVDAVLTDLYMPDMTGFDVLSHVNERSLELPVIVLSGQGGMRDVIAALRLGAADYIYKPVEEMDIIRLSIVRALEKARLVRENHVYKEKLEGLLAEKNAALVLSEKRYKTVADFTYNWEYWIAPDGRVVYMSPSCERVTGYGPQAFIERPDLLREIVHPDDQTGVALHLDDNRRIAEDCHIDFRIIRRDGEERWIAHACQAIDDAHGAYLGRRCSNRDITYRKTVENDLRIKQRELTEKTRGLEKANEALKALLDQREIEKRSIEETMVANLKRYVFPYLESLGASTGNKQAAAYADIIRTNIDQLISPVSSRLSGAYLSFTPTEIRVADLIRRGQSTKDIADTLNASPSTIAIHRNRIRKKLGLLNRKINLRTYLNTLT